jgi:hypothetical protein
MSLKGSQRRSIDQAVPPGLRPLLRAYILGYASSTAPRLLTLLLTYVSRRRKGEDGSLQGLRAAILRTLRSGLDFQRFPTFCATLVGGSTLLQVSITCWQINASTNNEHRACFAGCPHSSPAICQRLHRKGMFDSMLVYDLYKTVTGLIIISLVIHFMHSPMSLDSQDVSQPS